MKIQNSRESAVESAVDSLRATPHASYCTGVSASTRDLTPSHVTEGECVVATCDNCPRFAHSKYND